MYKKNTVANDFMDEWSFITEITQNNKYFENYCDCYNDMEKDKLKIIFYMMYDCIVADE